MLRHPSLSRRLPFPENRSSATGSAVLSNSRYVRDRNGNLKYVSETDLQGFPQNNIKVATYQNTVIITAKYEDINSLGEKSTHELRRELHLPLSIDLSTITCSLSDEGILTIEAFLLQTAQPVWLQSPHASRIRDGNANNCQNEVNVVSVNNSCARPRKDPRTITFNEQSKKEASNKPYTPVTNITANSNYRTSLFITPTPFAKTSATKGDSILKSSPNYRGNKSVRLSAPEFANHFEDHTAADRVGQTHFEKKCDNAKSRSHRYLRSNGADLQPIKRYTLRVNVGPQVTPGDIDVSLTNDTVIIRAQKFARKSFLGGPRRMVYEHHSEHTLPPNVYTKSLSARLENGTVILEAPFILPGAFGDVASPQHVERTPPIMSSLMLSPRLARSHQSTSKDNRANVFF
ncbi:unnamed protein product [Calicophoron daubneyi]|uniref:SHSP domain-containing protein n=1 Tax=Calicophoron daubneyi TaxID=300641 RepID=A0AAV2TFP3_CALDB